MPGRTISHYQVLDKIGQGGIGVVYKARDTLLNRPVALKVLRPEKVADPDRIPQFIREAQAASALNHPNVVTVHEIGEVEGVHFIVMEWIKGKTLVELVRHKGLTLDETLQYSTQIADALAKAHSAGIVHRDLKPANIMVTDDARVKVLDFGLAKLTEPPETNEFADTLDMERVAALERGVIEGTAAYMSPEQAEGKKLDARSDIFSFGSLLYEMVTGKSPFKADTRAATLAAILREDPKPVRSLVPAAPRALERIIAHCHGKDLHRRFQNMSDVHLALADVMEERETERLGGAADAAAASAGMRKRTWVAVTAGVVLGAVLVAGAWWLVRPGPAASRPLSRLTWDLGLSTDPALSSGGRLLAFASDRGGEGKLDIWVRHVGGGEALRVTRHPADEREPAFSPDGSRIAYRSEREQGGIYVVPSLGGDERLIARQGRRPRFSPDGVWIAYWVRDAETDWGKTYVVPASGGSARPVRPDFPDAHAPVWSPDGKQLLFCGTSEIKPPAEDTHDWWIVDLDRNTVLRTGAFAAFRRHGLPNVHLPGGWFGKRVVFAARVGDSRNLWQLTVSPGSRQIEGEPERLTFGTGIEDRPYITADGQVVFASGISNTGVWSLALGGADSRASRLQPVAHRAGTSNLVPSLSADGARCAFLSDREGRDEVWIGDLKTGRETALTTRSPAELSSSSAAFDLRPAWPVICPDGSRVAYRVIEAPSARSAGARPQSIYVVAAAGGAPEKLCEDCGRPTGWSSKGRQILFEPGERRPPITELDLATGRKREVLRQPSYSLHDACFSPDDRWIAFRANAGEDQGRGRVYIIPYGEGAPVEEKSWIPVTDGKTDDSIPRWSPDGNVLYFFSNMDGFLGIRARRLAPGTKRPQGEPFVVYRFDDARHPPSARFAFAVARDKIVFSLDELTSNIWMTRLPAQ